MLLPCKKSLKAVCLVQLIKKLITLQILEGGSALMPSVVENKIVNSVNFQTNKVNLVPKLLTTIDTDLRKIVEIQKINLDVTQQNKELFLSFYRDGQLSKFRSNAVLLILFLNFFVSALALIL